MLLSTHTMNFAGMRVTELFLLGFLIFKVLAHSAMVHAANAPMGEQATDAVNPSTPGGSLGERYRRSLASYTIPEVSLINQANQNVLFPKDIDNGRPVVLNFIFTSCTAICPLLSQTFSQFQRRLGPKAKQVNMVSISIDPEPDTPQHLSAYAQRYHAGPQWSFYTGKREDSLAIQKAFQAFYLDKMNHRPLIFMRRAPGQAWIRLEGFMTADDLLKEFRNLSAKP